MLDLTVEENIGDGSKILQLTAMDADEVGAWFQFWMLVLKAAFWTFFHLFPSSLCVSLALGIMAVIHQILSRIMEVKTNFETKML